MIARGFGTAAVLMFVVLALFVVARIIGAQTVASKERSAERLAAIFGPVRTLFLAGFRQLAPRFRQVTPHARQLVSLATKPFSKDVEK